MSNTEISMVVYYLMPAMLFTNSKQPSAGQIVTLTEYQNRKQITEGETYNIYKVRFADICT